MDDFSILLRTFYMHIDTYIQRERQRDRERERDLDDKLQTKVQIANYISLLSPPKKKKMQTTLSIQIQSNTATKNYFIIFLQIIVMANFLLVSYKSTTNMTFSFTNNHSPNQQFVKKIISLKLSLDLYSKVLEFEF